MPAVEYRKRNSILGSIALLLALPALALNYFNFARLPNVSVGPFELRFATAAAAGITLLAVVSTLLAGKSRRTGTEIPVAATLIGAAALCLGYYRHRVVTPPPPSAAPPIAAPSEVKQPAPAPSAASKAEAKRPILPNTSNVASQAKSLADTANDAVRQQHNLAALHEARSQFDAARAAVLKSLESDSEYTAAKSASDAADSQLKLARTTYPPGNPALINVSQAALAARDHLQQIIDVAIEKDPAAHHAQDQLLAAQAATKSPTGIKP